MKCWKYGIYLVLWLVITRVAVAEDIKRQPIPVGMFNVYASSDENNLSLSLPDLHEVWQGVPTNWEGGYYPYEACNLVQHYWPKELPADAPPNPDASISWWTQFLQEVYEQGNADGEVRLRAIVGPLFSHYQAFGDQWLTRFIQGLCEWEQSGQHNGVIAGWYLVEEPMGSRHNFSPDTFEKMVKVIDQAEASGGFRRHDRYVDVSVDGAFFTPQKLARFCRPADVVMISSSTYLWMTSGTQPVFEPRYRDLAFSMNQVRSIVFPDRDSRGLPHPQIHLVLQAYDPIGFGQPTHWEMRQQIRRALTPDFELLGNKSVAPADGIWFFWWPGLTFENEDRVDDWLYGRRLAEAIELEVAEVTGRGSEARSVNLPTASRFAFPPLAPFNPDDGIIPYELARSGRVEIEILDMNGSSVEKFNMGVQSAGRLHQFGGPRWHPLSTAADGRYIFRLFLNNALADSVDVEVQRRSHLLSPSHDPSVWSHDDTIDVEWRPPALSAGLDGFSFVWSDSPSSLPPRTIKLGAFDRTLTSSPLPDGNSHYFHLRSVDKNGVWSVASHLGPFWIDTTPPTRPTDVVSSSHEIGRWSSVNTVDIAWSAATDEASGLRGYSIVWDNQPFTLPAEEINVGSKVTALSTPPLVDGVWYLHLRAVDVAGNWTDGVHVGSFQVDTHPPHPPSDLVSSSHEIGVWSNRPEIELTWNAASDETSGVANYLIVWDASPDTIPPPDSTTLASEAARPTYHSPPLEDGDAHYVHLSAIDRAGNLAAQPLHLGPFWIDTTPPSDVPSLSAYPTTDLSQPLDLEKWLRTSQIAFAWQPSADAGSGVSVYEITQTRTETGETMRFQINANSPLQWTPATPLNDGEWKVRVRAGDRAGNWGELAALTLRIDTVVPTPLIRSPSHPNPDVWYPNPNPIIEWTIADDLSGIAGYLGEWDNQPGTAPQSPIDSENKVFSLPNGVWYFHLRAIDNAGNLSEVTHYKVQIDRAVPETPIIHSPTHPINQWSSSRIVDLRWEDAATLSGSLRYSFAFDHASDTIPDDEPEAVENSQIERALDDGIWYFHLKAISRTGIPSQAAHYRLQIDSRVATPTINSPSHPNPDVWYPNPNPIVKWTIAADLSGIAGYLGEWDNRPDTVPQSPINSENKVFALQNGTWYFHLRAIDNAGNLSETAHYRVRIDATAPTPPVIQSSTHPEGVWRSQSTVDLRWNIGANPSGVAGYSFLLDRQPTTMPDERIDAVQSQWVSNLADGIWYFHLRSQSNTGLWSKAAHYEIRIDTAPPEITIETPRGGAWLREAITSYSGEMHDELSGIDETTLEYRFGNLDWTPFANEASKDWRDTDELPHLRQADGTPLQIRVRDRSGNVGRSEEIDLMVDVELPSLTVTSPTHPSQDVWYADPQPTVRLTAAQDFSGIADFFWAWDRHPKTVPMPSDESTKHLMQYTVRAAQPLSEGIWYFHAIAIDNAGNASDPVHYRFQIDTQPPKAAIQIAKPSVIEGRPKSIRYLPAEADPPHVSSGEIQIELQLSEEIVGTPRLFFQPNGKPETSLDLTAVEASPNRAPLLWRTALRITPRIGDGAGRFRFVGTDRAGNAGNEITAGQGLIIDTRIDSNETQKQYRIGDNDAIVTIPPHSLRSDIHLYLESVSGESVGQSRYRLIAWEAHGRLLPQMTFAMPIELQFPIPSTSPAASGDLAYTIFYDDGVRMHPIGTGIADGQLMAQVSQTGEFLLAPASKPKRKMTGGWAAPNPFTPNNSGDPSDRTIFHVQTANDNISFTIEIYDLTGRRVRTLHNGLNVWDGRDESGVVVEGGVYIYQIRAEDEVISGTVVVVR